MTTKLETRRDELLEEMRALADEDLEGAELERFEALDAEIQDVNKRIQIFRLAQNPTNTEHGDDRGAPQYQKKTETRVDLHTATRTEVRDAALATLEREHNDQKFPISDETAASIERNVGRVSRDRDGNVQFDGGHLARRLLITETDAYRSAWQKALRDERPAWTTEEVQALNEFRAEQQSLTDASGGLGVPTLIDPTIIITSGAGTAPLLDVARVEQITSTAWRGVASEGVAFTSTPEFTAVTADHAELTQPTVTPEKATAYLPYSFEIEGDFPGFATEMARVIEQAYIDFLAEETITGSAGVVGIFNAIDAVAASEVIVGTDQELHPADALIPWNALPERYRSRATWVMNVTSESAMRTGADGFGTRDLSSEGIGPLLGKRVLLSDYARAFDGTSGTVNIAVLGAFDRYLVAQRIGMQVELVRHVVDGDGIPLGARAWLAWSRVGAGVTDANAFRLLKNAT